MAGARGAGVASAIPVVYLPPPARVRVARFAVLWPQTSILTQSGWRERSLPTASAPQSVNVQEHALQADLLFGKRDGIDYL